jgi:hypothetical protein
MIIQIEPHRQLISYGGGNSRGTPPNHLEHDDISIMNNMFNANIPASVISRVLAGKKGKDESLGYTADMNHADKTLMKLKE